MPSTNWWVHNYADAQFLVDHVYFHTGATTVPVTPPSPGYVTIEQAQAALGTMAPGTTDWHIHRQGKAGSATRTYVINHDPDSPGAKHCPGFAPGYASLSVLAAGLHLSALHNEDSCNPT